MAKHTDEPKREEHPAHPAPAPHAPEHAAPLGGGARYLVQFPGQAVVSVTAPDPLKAAEAAAQQLGVLSSERPPEVTPDTSPPPPEAQKGG